MAELYFKVKADYDKVVRLREEIAKLETQLKNVSTTTPKAEIDKLQNNLSRAKEEFNGITTAAAKAAASMGGDFKTKIKEATTTINELSGKIIEQKAVIKDVEADVRRLGEAYRNSMKGGKGGSAEKKADYLSAKKALQEEKAALFALTQQQSKAKLSLKELNDEYKEFKEGSEDNADIFDELKNKLMGVGTVIAGGIGVKEFVGKMIQVRGEFQAMETALQTMLGSKEKADELLAKVKEYAKISPLELSSVSNATKMMLGFNIEAEKIPTYLKAIGDVSMGDAGKFNSLTLAFSQMSAAGKLMGQDLLQMVNAGFNPLSVISEQTGKSIGQLREEMSKGAISAEMIQKAFIDATSAGGKFYNMSENAAKTINGQISMMQDAIDAAFNEMGQASEGVIMGAIKGVTSVIENYQTLGKVVAAAAATYGVYKAAVLATIAVEKIHAVSRMAAIAHTTTLSMATDVLAKKLGLVNLVAKANPYVLLATAIAGVVAAMWAFYSSTNEAEKANKAFEESMNRVTQKTDELKSKTDSLIKTMEDVSIAEGIRKDSFLELKMLYPDILSDIKSENEFLAKKHELLQLINGEQGKRTRLTIEDEIRKFEADLKHYQHVLNTGTSTSLVDMDGNGWATDNVVDAIRETKNNVNKAKAELAQTYIPDMLSEIKDLDTEVLNSRLEETTNILTALGESSQDAIGLLSFGDVSEYSKGQISKINQALKDEIGNRNSEKKSHTEWLQSLYDTYNKAQKALDDFYKKKDKMSKDNWQKENDKLKKERDAAKQAYEKAGGKTIKSEQKEEKDRVKAKEEANKKLLELTQENEKNEAELEENANKKKLDQIEASYNAQANKIKQKEKELLELNKKQGLGDKLTTEQRKAIDKANELNTQSRLKQEKEVYDAQVASMRNYLKEYGTFQQQRLAIAEDYADKISKAQKAGDTIEVARLEKERQSVLSQNKAKELAMDIDWSQSFKGIGNVLSEIATETLKKVEDYMKTAEFKALDAKDKKAYIDLRNNLRQEGAGETVSPFNFKIWGDIEKQTKIYQDAVAKRIAAEEAHTKAVEERSKIEETFTENMSEHDKELAKSIADRNVESTAHNLENAKDEETESKDNLTDSTNKAVDGLDNFTQAINEMSSGSLYGFANGVTKIIGGLTKNSKAASEGLAGLGKVGGIVGAILQILEAVGDNPTKFIEDLLDNIAATVEAVITELPQILLKVIEGVWDILGGVLEGIGSWFGIDKSESDPTLNKDIEKLTSSNEVLRESIDNLAKKMDEGLVSEASEIYNKQLEQILQSQSNTKEMMQRSASASSGGFWGLGIGGHHATTTKMNEKLSTRKGDGQSEYTWRDVNKVLGTSITSAQEFFNLTSEQMAKLREEAPELWAYIKSAADDGYKDAGQFMDEYADYAAQIEELERKKHEKLTGLSFDTLRDNFKNALMNMSSDADAFTKDFENMMKNITFEMITDKYSGELEKWYEAYAAAVESGGELTPEEIAELREWYNNIQKGAAEEARQTNEIMGWGDESTTSQEASRRGFGTEMTHEDAGELSGRFTALQLAGEEIKSQAIAQTQSLNLLTMRAENLLALNQGMHMIADDIRTQIANSYLELVGIRENTSAIVKPIIQMQRDMAEVKENIKNI